jgi:RHS repeat-associated protein
MAQASGKGWLWGVLAAAAIVATARGQSGVTLSGVVVPAAAQPGVHTVAVTGSGFPAGTIPAANVTVTLVPSSGAGTSATAPATGVQGLYAGTRRVSFAVPAAIAVATPTAYKISIAGTTDAGTAFASTATVTLTINPPAQILSLTPSTTAPGSTTAIQIVTRYTEFVAGATMASFGAGASVGGGPVGGFGPVSVTGPTTATAIVTMSADAAGGERAATVATGVQTATLAQGITVTSAPVTNQAPRITSSPATAATALQPYAYQATATDADNDTLTWALTAAPSGMTVVPGTGAITWTPAAALAGTHAVTVQVGDGKGGLDTQTFSVVVAAAPANQAPHITTTPGTTAMAGQAYSYAPAATDADGDTLTWTLTQSPVGMAIMPGTGAITWTPGTGQVGAQTVTLSVSDGHGGTDGQAFAVAVARPPNQAPHITSSAVTSGRATEAYSYTVTATDPDSDPLTFALTAAPSGMTIGATTGAISWTPTAQHAGSQSVTVRVNDGRGGSDTQSFSITVLPAANQAPTPRITGPTTGTVSQSLTFDASTSTDPDQDTLTFGWMFGDGATAAGASVTHGYATSGTFTVSLTANDGHGHAPTATRSVVVSPPANRPPVAVAGGPYSGEAGIPVTLSGTASSDPDGNALTYAWSFGDQGTGTGASPSHAYAAVGTYTVTLTVSDVHQATNSATTSVTVAAAVDRSPPLVTLAAPRQALPGATVTINIDARDNIRVSSVVLAVEGDTPTTFTNGPYSRTYTLPGIAAPGSVIHLTATATDPSNNTGQAAATIVVAAQPDIEPPTATLTAPPQAAPGTTVILSADAHDNVGVTGVAFTVDGAPIGTVATPPYVTTWAVPSNATAGTVFAMLATASDAGGLTGAASASLTVVAVASASADPSVTLTVPPTVPAGGTVDLTAVAIADPTVASVAFTVDGARVAIVVTPPYATSYAVPAGLRNGATLQVQAEVTDGLGRTARDAKTATVQASAAPGMGVMYGHVFDDTTGLAIANATVTLVSTSITTTTDAQGRYTVTASEGPGTLRVTKAGWSRVDRPVTFVAGNTAFRVLDARLTPLAAAGSAIQAVVGGTMSQSGWALVVPGGALGADTAMVLTAIGGQGLQGRLPLGWAPVTTVDIAPHGSALAPSATLKAPTQATVATLVLARWDETAAAWRAVTTATGTTLEALVVSTGQYAWLRSDTTPSAPAMPADGALLEGVPAAAIPEAATTRVTPNPKILFYSPGVFSTVTGIVTSPSALPSGSPLTLALNEVYHFLDATNATPERITQDLVAYQSPAVPTDAEAVFPATPSLTFEAISLRDGVITAALYTQGAETGVPLLGAAGGVVNGTAGEQLEIPPAAAPAAPMALATLTQADAGLTLPADAMWLAGVTFTFSGELALPGRLSVAKPSGLTDASQVLLVRVRESNGQTQYLLVARARLEGDRLIADTSLPGSSDILDGVRLAGRYVFVQAASPLAFSVGAVSGVSGAPFAGAMVTNDRLAIGALSTATGRYAQAMPGGGVTLTAFDETKRDAGAGTGTGIAGLTITVDLALVVQPPSVVSITPVDGATSVALSDPIVVRFSEPVAPATVTAQAVQLAGPSGPVTASLSLTSNNTVATLRPPSALDANAAYTVTVDTTITDLAGYALPAKVTAHFTSLSTTPPPAPPAGNLSATIPSNGATTVAGTQGSAGLHDTVAIVNVTQKTSTPALVDPNGSFSAVVNAGLTDKLKIEITDPAGNKTSVDVPRFQNPDGSVAIGPEGGRITAAGDLALDIADGTFPAGAIVKFTALTPEQFNSPVKAEWGYPMVAAFELSSSAAPQRYLDVSAPAPPGTDPRTPGIVAELVTVAGGQRAMSVVDTATIVDGRLRTASPPCPGIVQKYARYAMYLNTSTQKDNFALSLLRLTVPRSRDIIIEPYVLNTMDVTPWYNLPIALYPGMQIRGEPHSPAAPFINLIHAGLSGETALLAAAIECMPVQPDISMHVVIRDASTGGVITTVPVAPATPRAVVPVNITFVDPWDTDPARITWTSWNPRTQTTDSGKSITVRFNKAVGFGNLAGGGDPVALVDQATGQEYSAFVSFDRQNREMKLTPKSPLPMGREFAVVTPGLFDQAGNRISEPVTFKTYRPQVIAPTSAWPFDHATINTDLQAAGAPVPYPSSPGVQDYALNDIDFITSPPEYTPSREWQTTLFGIGLNRDKGFALLTVNANRPTEMKAVGSVPGGERWYSRLTVLRDAAIPGRAGAAADTPAAQAWRSRTLHFDTASPSVRQCDTGDRNLTGWLVDQTVAGRSMDVKSGCGHLAAFTTFNVYYSILHLFDVTDPAHPASLGTRLLSDNGAEYGFPPRHQVAKGFGMARGLDIVTGVDITHTTPGGTFLSSNSAAAYTAVSGVGLSMVDVGRNIPGVEEYERLQSSPVIESQAIWTFPYYQDVKVLRGHVVALAGDLLDATGIAHVEVFQSDLGTPIGSPVPLPFRPRAMTLAEGLPFDVNGDGRPDSADFALISGDVVMPTGSKGGFATVYITPSGVPTLAAYVATPGTPPTPQAWVVDPWVTGTCPSHTFIVQGDRDMRVEATASTRYHYLSCFDIMSGKKIKIRRDVTVALTNPEPTASRRAAPGLVDNGPHRYKVVFVTPQGRYVGSGASVPVVIDNQALEGEVRITAWPRGSSRVTSYEIYRTAVAEPNVFRYVGAVRADAPFDFTDNVPDSALGSPAPDVEIEFVRAADISDADAGDRVTITSLRHVQFDREGLVAYVGARWMLNGAEQQGLVAIDVSRLGTGLIDEDRDGWDDRIIGRIPIIGAGQAVPAGNVNGFRFDPQRNLIYIAVDAYPKNGSDKSIVIVQARERQSVRDTITLGGGEIRYITPAVATAGTIIADISVKPSSGTSLTYEIIEKPISGLASDALLDLAAMGGATGTMTRANPHLYFSLVRRPFNDLPRTGSIVNVDFFDASGAFVDRLSFALLPTKIETPTARVQTRIDKTNKRVLDEESHIEFGLPYDATVTVRLDGAVVVADLGGGTIGPVQNIKLPGGWNRVPITGRMVGVPGEHTYTIEAAFDTTTSTTAAGTVIHDVVILESLPLGHTFVKGVDLADGHTVLSRTDITIPGVVAPLDFTRTYSSAGMRSAGSVGAGWGHNWEMSLRVETDGTITLSAGSGGGGMFTWSGTAPGGVVEYKPQAGYHGTLTYRNGEFDYVSKEGTRFHYVSPDVAGSAAGFRLSYIEDTNGNRVTLTYDRTKLVKVTDPVGRFLAFTYAQKGLVPEDRVVEVNGPLNLTVTFDYDKYGNLTTAKRGEGTGPAFVALRSESYEYTDSVPDDRHNLKKVTDPSGSMVSFEYYSGSDRFPGEVTPYQWGQSVVSVPVKTELVRRVTEGDALVAGENVVTGFVYDYSQMNTKLVTTVTSGQTNTIDTVYTMHPRGPQTEMRIKASGGDVVSTTKWAFEAGIDDIYPVKQVDTAGRVTEYVYDANGNVTDETVYLDGTTGVVAGYAQVKDASGRPISKLVSHYEYDPKFNRQVVRVDPTGMRTEADIDPANGRLLATREIPNDSFGTPTSLATFSYTDTGSIKGVLKSATKDGRTTTFSRFDAWGDAVETIDPVGITTTLTYDERSRLLGSSDTHGHASQTTYDGLDRTLTLTQRAGTQPSDPAMASADRISTFTYYPGGQKKTASDGSITASYVYDAVGRLETESKTVTDADGTSMALLRQVSYDELGRKWKDNDRGLVQTTEYDDLDRIRKVTMGTKVTNQFAYDIRGNKLSETDLHGNTTTFEYDRLFRVIRKRLPLAPYTQQMEYDLAGLIVKTVDANGGTSRMVYDGFSRLRQKVDAIGRQLLFDYDAYGNLTEEADTTTGLTVTRSYDAIGRPLTEVKAFSDPVTHLPVRYIRTYAYDDTAHRVTTTQGATTVEERLNGFDNVIEHVVDPAGLALLTVNQYNAQGKVTAVSDPEGPGRDLVTTYDGLGRPIHQQYLLGGEEKFYYDVRGELVMVVDRAGIQHEFAYDDLGRKTHEWLIESITNGAARTEIWHAEYDDPASAGTTWDASGNATRQELDALGRAVRSVDAFNRAVVTVWDGINTRAETDRRGLRREFDYDALSRLTAVRELDQAGEVRASTTTQYLDAAGKRIETDQRGVETILLLDPLQRVRQESRRHASFAQAYGAEELGLRTVEYDDRGNVVRTVGWNGAVRTAEYDAANRATATIDAAGTSLETATSFTYDGTGKMLTVKDGRNTGSAFDLRTTYDERHRKVQEENAAGAVSRYTYYQDDLVETSTEPLGGVTRYSYNERRQVIAVDESRNGTGGVTRFVYDVEGNRLAQQDAAGRLSSWIYDALNHATDSYHHSAPGTISIQRTAPIGGDLATARHVHSDYDENGNEIRLVDPDGQVVQKTWDWANRLTRKDYSGHATGEGGVVVYPRPISIVYHYDADGNIVQVADTKQADEASSPVTEISEKIYDKAGRVISETNPDGKTLQYAYSVDGDRLSVTDADGLPTSYTYDVLHRVATVTDRSSGSATVATYDYYPNGLQHRATYPGGTTTEWTFDKAGRATAILNKSGDRVVSRFDYTYDANSNRTAETQTMPSLTGDTGVAVNYEYDALNRLTKVAYPGNSELTYGYGPAGDRLTESGSDAKAGQPVARRYRYDGLGQLHAVLDSADTNASRLYTYDSRGNLTATSIGAVDPDTLVMATPVSTQRFDFDIRDRLVTADALDGSARVNFDYDYGNRRTRMDSAFAKIRFLYDQSAVLQEYDATTKATTHRYVYGAALIGLVSATSGGRTSQWYLFDGQASTANLVDEGGVTVASYLYDAWGGTRLSADTTSNRRRYTGHDFDTETGLHYFGARYYDDATARFLSRDPFAGNPTSPPSLNAYTFAAGNPFTYGDPDGRAINLIPALAGGVIGGVVGCIWGATTEGVGCGKGLLVGAGTGALAGLTFGASLAATGGVVAGGSTWVALTATTAVGTLAGNTFGGVARGRSWKESYQDATVETLMATLPVAFGGPLGEAALGGGLLRQMAAGTLEQAAAEYTLVALGAQEDMNMAAIGMGGLAPVGTAAVSKAVSIAASLPGKANAAAITLKLMTYRRFVKPTVDTIGDKGVLVGEDALMMARQCLAPNADGCSVVGGLVRRAPKVAKVNGKWEVDYTDAMKTSWWEDTKDAAANFYRNASATMKGAKSQSMGPCDEIKCSGDVDFILNVRGKDVMNDARMAVQMNQKSSVAFQGQPPELSIGGLFDYKKTHGIMGKYFPQGMLPSGIEDIYRRENGLAPDARIVAADYWKTGISVGGGKKLAPFFKPGDGTLTWRAVEPTYSFSGWLRGPRIEQAVDALQGLAAYTMPWQQMTGVRAIFRQVIVGTGPTWTPALDNK